MSLIYAEGKIREALMQAKGNKTRAMQIVMAAAAQDLPLLQGLTKHHLNGIVAYHLERVVSGRTTKEKSGNTNEQTNSITREAASRPQSTSINPPASGFGMELLKAAASSNEIFGFDSGLPQGKRQPASQTHINAIRQIAARAKGKTHY